ncbi:hypothetical protein GQ568_02725 [Patescibacteria group bacterium]|nr:hypothetical protein [Patescibacteria group bacterium]
MEMEEMGRKLIMIVVIFVLTTAVACAGNPPQAIITCNGCQEISEGYLLVYADYGNTMTLRGISSQDDVGIVSYIWTKDEIIVSKNAQCSFIVTEDTKYVLTVTDGENKSDSEMIEIRLKYVAPPNRCLPDWKGEIISSNNNDLIIGDKIVLDANLQSSDCVDWKIEWYVVDDNIIINNKNSERTQIEIGEGTKIGTHTIKVVLSNSEKSREHKTQINVIRNTPPTLVVNYEFPYSYGTLYVDFSESKTGISGNENNDRIRYCYVRLEDKHGSFVSDGSWNVNRDRMPLSVKVETVKMGTHFIIATIKDSHGLVSTVKEEIWVKEGDSKHDPLIVRVSSDRITCIAGEECKFSAYQTLSHYEGKSINFVYYDVTYKSHPEKLANPDGHYLTGPEFRHIFPYSGNYVVRVTATSGDRSGVAEVVVTVTDNGTVLEPTPTLIPISTQTEITSAVQQPTVPYQESTATESADKIPGMEAWMAITMIIMAIVFKRKKKIS